MAGILPRRKRICYDPGKTWGGVYDRSRDRASRRAGWRRRRIDVEPRWRGECARREGRVPGQRTLGPEGRREALSLSQAHGAEGRREAAGGVSGARLVDLVAPEL